MTVNRQNQWTDTLPMALNYHTQRINTYIHLAAKAIIAILQRATPVAIVTNNQIAIALAVATKKYE